MVPTLPRLVFRGFAAAAGDGPRFVGDHPPRPSERPMSTHLRLAVPVIALSLTGLVAAQESEPARLQWVDLDGDGLLDVAALTSGCDTRS